MSRSSLEDEAVALYGVARDPAEASWILRDGTLLDTPEGYYGGHRGHGEIVALFKMSRDDATKAIHRFLREAGAVRVGEWESLMLHTWGSLSMEQIQSSLRVARASGVQSVLVVNKTGLDGVEVHPYTPGRLRAVLGAIVG